MNNTLNLFIHLPLKYYHVLSSSSFLFFFLWPVLCPSFLGYQSNPRSKAHWASSPLLACAWPMCFVFETHDTFFKNMVGKVLKSTPTLLASLIILVLQCIHLGSLSFCPKELLQNPLQPSSGQCTLPLFISTCF